MNKKTKQTILDGEIPNFKPVKFDGTRLDERKDHLIIIKFDTRRERDEAYKLLKRKGYTCQKSY